MTSKVYSLHAVFNTLDSDGRHDVRKTVFSGATLSITFPIRVKRDDFNQLPGVAAVSRAVNITGAISDVAIASSLVLLLNRSRTGFKPTESVINRLILFTIQTGLLTSTCMVFSLAFVRIL